MLRVRLRTKITLALLCGAALFLSYALLARYVLHGPVDEMSLAVSVRREAGGTDETVGGGGTCHRIAPYVWTCSVGAGYDARHSMQRYVAYRVRIRSGSCWEGRLAVDSSGRTRMPRALSGCVHRWQWSLLGML